MGNRWEKGFDRSLLGLGKTKKVKPLTEEAAVDNGAEILGEFFIYTVGVYFIFLELRRSSRKEDAKEAKLENTLISLDERVISLENNIFLMNERVNKLVENLDTLQLTLNNQKTENLAIE